MDYLNEKPTHGKIRNAGLNWINQNKLAKEALKREGAARAIMRDLPETGLIMGL
jgi:hypothetical protein